MLHIRLDSFDFTKVRLETRSKEVQEFEVKDMMYIDENNLQKELVQHSAYYAYWTSLLGELEGSLRVVQRNLEVKMAQLDGEARKVLIDSGQKPVKESVHAYIIQSEPYQSLRTEKDAYETLIGRVKWIVECYKQKGFHISRLAKGEEEDSFQTRHSNRNS